MKDVERMFFGLYVHPVPRSLQDFVTALSILLRGTVREKLQWTFNLYDINKDGYINKEVLFSTRRATNAKSCFVSRLFIRVQATYSDLVALDKPKFQIVFVCRSFLCLVLLLFL